MRRIAAILVVVGMFAAAAPTWASNHDLAVQQFFLPATSTAGLRAHTSATEFSLTIRDKIIAGGGYKSAFAYAHNEQVVVNSSNISVPIAGSSRITAAETGPLYHRVPYAGSVIGVAIQSSRIVTALAAHAEAMTLRGSTATASGLTAVIGNGLTQTQYASATQGRGADIFVAGDGVGCRMSVDNGFTPTTAVLVCTVYVEY